MNTGSQTTGHEPWRSRSLVSSKRKSRNRVLQPSASGTCPQATWRQGRRWDAGTLGGANRSRESRAFQLISGAVRESSGLLVFG